MGVTTEPPWVNFSTGVAARNGTTTHAINFGYTSTSGSLLCVLVFGGVTNTVAGWTKQAGPVSSGELSLFTKTSAGDSSISVTHNAANYPSAWAAYEFYTGSTLTAVDSDNASAETFTGLTGLPGTAQVIIGARGRIAGSTAATGASTAWIAPWVADVDSFTVFATTDGCYLTVGRQINVTATSITPSATTTYSGTWAVNDREKINFAINAVQPPGAADSMPRRRTPARGLVLR